MNRLNCGISWVLLIWLYSLSIIFLLVIFYYVYETHSTCTLFISSWCLKGNGIQSCGLYTFVWQKIAGGVVIIFLWPFILRNCREKYCPQDRGKKKNVVSALHEEISAFSSRHCIHSLSNPLSLGDILPRFPATVTVYRLGQSADSVVCYMYVVVGFVCMYVRNMKFVPSNSSSLILCSLNMYVQKAFS